MMYFGSGRKNTMKILLVVVKCVVFMLSHSESILYSSSQTENVPKVVEDGDSPLQFSLH